MVMEKWQVSFCVHLLSFIIHNHAVKIESNTQLIVVSVWNGFARQHMSSRMTILNGLTYLVLISAEVQNSFRGLHVWIRCLTRSERCSRDVKAVVLYSIHDSEAGFRMVSREDNNLDRLFLRIDFVEPKQPLNEWKRGPRSWWVCSVLFLVLQKRIEALCPVNPVRIAEVKKRCR